MATTAKVVSHTAGAIAINGTQAVKEKELHNNPRGIHVEFEKFYGIEPLRVDRRFDLRLSDLSYLPKVNNPHADWVITAALNAFRAYQCAGFGAVRRFATIGTGSGTDVIAALEVFDELSSVAMTDMHEEVVEAAKSNVVSATEKSKDSVRHIAVQAVAQSGDLLLPIQKEEPFDLIYENLPNIPLSDDKSDLRDGQTSSTYVSDRSKDKVPRSVSRSLLELHYVCLIQAKSFGLLDRDGAILSSIGGRVPIEAVLGLADLAGYSGRILTLWWKEQSEPESVIGGYAEHEDKGLGPFHFYPILALEQAFSNFTPAGAGLHAVRVLDGLLPDRLNAVQAFQKYREGIRIGHTVLVMASVLQGSSKLSHPSSVFKSSKQKLVR